MYYQDLSQYRYLLKTPLSDVLNVGWLVEGHPYAQGDVDDWVLPKLAAVILASAPFDAHVNRMRGSHPCSLSRNCAKPVTFETRGRAVTLGASELWIPARQRMWAAPSMVYHYIEQHHYQPPELFIADLQALRLDVPFNAQQVYLKAVARHF